MHFASNKQRVLGMRYAPTPMVERSLTQLSSKTRERVYSSSPWEFDGYKNVDEAGGDRRPHAGSFNSPAPAIWRRASHSSCSMKRCALREGGEVRAAQNEDATYANRHFGFAKATAIRSSPILDTSLRPQARATAI